MIARIVSALILIPLVILAILDPWNQPVILYSVYFAAGSLLAWEFFSFSRTKIENFTKIITILSIGLYYILKYQTLTAIPAVTDGFAAEIPLFLVYFSVLMVYVFKHDFKTANANLIYAVTALVTCGIIFSYGLDVRYSQPEIGGMYLLYLFVISWMYDTGGLFIGVWLGKKNKLGLASSPNKSWAGLFGGLVFACAGFAVFDMIGRGNDSYRLTWFFSHPAAAYLLTCVLAIISQFGDLIESVMKRSAGIKDSGTMIKGHGGIYDAVDGLVPLQFAMYFFLKFFG